MEPQLGASCNPTSAPDFFCLLSNFPKANAIGVTVHSTHFSRGDPCDWLTFDDECHRSIVGAEGRSCVVMLR